MCISTVAKYRMLIGNLRIHFLYSLLLLAGFVFAVKASDLLPDPNFQQHDDVEARCYNIYTIISICIYLSITITNVGIKPTRMRWPHRDRHRDPYVCECVCVCVYSERGYSLYELGPTTVPRHPHTHTHTPTPPPTHFPLLLCGARRSPGGRDGGEQTELVFFSSS